MAGPWVTYRQEVIDGKVITTKRWITDDPADPHKEEVGPIAFDYLFLPTARDEDDNA